MFGLLGFFYAPKSGDFLKCIKTFTVLDSAFCLFVFPFKITFNNAQ